MIFPPALHPGDTVAIVSPAGYIDPQYVVNAKQIIKQWGLHVVVGSHTLGKSGRFSGTITERLQDLQYTLDNPDIKAVFCSRGGYGVVHLLHSLRFNAIWNAPKWIIGYSDITALHASMQLHNIASIHAPMCRHLSEEGEDKSVLYLKEILFGDLPRYLIPSHPLNRRGRSCGTLRGGNLSVLSGLCGTPYDIPVNDTILFIEDIGEKPYQIERMFYNLKLSGVLNMLSGLIIGRFTEYEEDPGMPANIEQVILNLVAEYNYPVCFGFPVGHVKENYPLVCGASVSLEVDDAVRLLF